jgi:hypothetical protein
MGNWKWAAVAFGALCAIGVACSDDSAEVGSTQSSSGGNVNSGGNGTGGAGATSAGGGSVGGAAGVGGSGAGQGGIALPTREAPCGNQTYDCGDLEDNDGDGLVDSQDPDCLGPCDNTEDSYYPNLPGMSGQNCDIDCFWDQGQGHDENCYWDHHCDPFADTSNAVVHPQTECAWDSAANGPVGGETFPPSPLTCDEMFTMQPQMCLDECKPLAPNGCDCFGCCELTPGVTVWLGSVDATDAGSCTVEAVGQADFFDKCHPCTQVPGCNNPCEHCEICINKPILPPDCFPGSGGGGQGGSGGAPQECPVGQQACGLPGQPACPSGHFCITGCCVPLN